jgi:hypothetical protein
MGSYDPGMRRTFSRSALVLVGALVASSTVAAAAGAAVTPPTVTTGKSGSITSSSAKVTGVIDPHGARTTYLFEYGSSRSYGSKTEKLVFPGKTTSRKAVTLTGLQPGQTYHYRVTANNSGGFSVGKDRTFKTTTEPLSFELRTFSSLLTYGGDTGVAGRVVAVDGREREVRLQQSVFPFSSPFQTIGVPQQTKGGGYFSFPISDLLTNTRYRVAVLGDGGAVSPSTEIKVRLRASVRVSTRRVRRGTSVRFSGTIRPALPGAKVSVQRRTSTGAWRAVAGANARPGGDDFSRYIRRARVTPGSTYRVFVSSGGAGIESSASKSVRMRQAR